MIDEGLDILARRNAGALAPLAFLDLDVPLWPGLHVVTGDVGVGKSQLALQAAICAARHGAVTAVNTPLASVAETTARLLGLVNGASWSAIYAGDLSVDAGALSSLPLAIRAAPTDETLVVTDRCPRHIDRDREQTVIATVDAPIKVDAASLMDLPADRVLAHVQIDPELVAAADTVFVLATMPPHEPGAWRGARLAVAHRRAGVPRWIDLRFDGTRFEREAEEIQIEFDAES